jgi:hypothetical protein
LSGLTPCVLSRVSAFLNLPEKKLAEQRIDDALDWQRESAKMRDVYENSYLTIAASSAVSSHQSFLARPSNPSIKIPWEHPYNVCIRGVYHLSHRSTPAIGSYWVSDVLRSQWSERGWTLQERLLSRRVLYFGKQAMHFQCQEYRFMENLVSVERCEPEDTWHRDLNVLSVEEIYKKWYRTVEEYTNRNLSFAKDKLPAIAGLANDVGQALNARGHEDIYLAGLWKRDLVRGLLWQITAPPAGNPILFMPDEYRAPSWCWTAHEGLIIMDHYRLEMTLCNILEAEVTISGDNPMTGPVTYGFVKLSGSLKHLNSELFSKQGGIFEQLLQKHSADSLGKYGHLKRVDVAARCEDVGWVVFDWSKQDYALALQGKLEVWALLVGLRWTRRPSTSLMPVGLLLTPTGNRHKGVVEFRRVGMFEPELPEMPSYTAEPAYAKQNIFHECQRTVIMIV